MAYGQVSTFLNELVLRAACIIAYQDLGILSGPAAEAEARSEHRKGFYPIGRVIELLEEYSADRGRYSDFLSYGPILLERLASESRTIVEKGSREGYSGEGVPTGSR